MTNDRSPVALSIFGVIPKRIGGVERLAHETSRQLGEMGWRSVLCFPSAPGELVCEFLDLPNVRVEAGGELFGSARSAWRPFLALMNRYRPAVVHFSFTGFLTPFPWIARLRGARRVFFTDQQSRAEGHHIEARPLWKRIATAAINQPLTKVVCISEYVARCDRGLRVLPAHKYQVIYNAVDTSCVGGPESGQAFRRLHGIPSEGVLVTQVSNMIPEKGFADLLKAAAEVAHQNSNIYFAIVGEGPQRSDCETLAGKLGIRDRVVFTGLSSDPFGEGVYAAADIVCQLSRWEEGFGYSIAEAMLHGKPVIATAVGAIPEIVEEGRTGFLVPRGDSAAVARHILELGSRPALRASLGGRAREVVREKFSLRASVAEHLKLYGIAAGEYVQVARA